MTENEALDKAKEILSRGDKGEFTIDDGRNLMGLKDVIDNDKFGDLMEEFIDIAPFEVVLELNDLINELNC